MKHYKSVKILSNF